VVGVWRGRLMTHDSRREFYRAFQAILFGKDRVETMKFQWVMQVRHGRLTCHLAGHLLSSTGGGNMELEHVKNPISK
jgi:hypothetical protein